MSEIKIIPLGGVRENGKNMYVVEVNDEIFVLDCGLKYPENELLGIDVVIPDFSYLEENVERIAGVFLTHGHADAIGALPYFLQKFQVPVFGTKLTIELAKIDVQDNQQVGKFDDYHVIDESTEIDFENATISFFKTTHTIANSVGICIKTEEGTIVYTGDFKFDQTSQGDYQTDFARLAEIGKSNVLALLSDSANAEAFIGEVSSEKKIAEEILDTFNYHDSRIVVACVASNLLRVQQVLDAAYHSWRKVVLTGHDLTKIIKTAIKLGKLKMPSEDLIIDIKDMKKYQPEELVILETGRMGEPIKSLQKMATSANGSISIKEGDLVYVTTTPSTAMETTLAKTKDMVYRAGGEMRMITDKLNASGHASPRDLQLMLNFMQPKFFIPIQGEYRKMAAHADLANEVGIPYENIFITGRGDVVSYSKEKMHMAGQVEAGNTMIDGIGVGDIGNIVLRDRKILSEDGIFIVAVTVSRKDKKIITPSKITSRGFVYVKTSRDLMKECGAMVDEIVLKHLESKDFEWSKLKQDVREHLSKFLFEQTKRRPVILPVMMEVHHKRKAE